MANNARAVKRAEIKAPHARFHSHMKTVQGALSAHARAASLAR
jgi:hypothetical protein